jgi:hypothetical protein
LADIYDIETFQPRKAVGHLVNRVRNELLAALDAELETDKRLARLELSSAQYIILATLALSDTPKSASDLCKGISYDAGAMTRMIDRRRRMTRTSTEMSCRSRRRSPGQSSPSARTTRSSLNPVSRS